MKPQGRLGALVLQSPGCVFAPWAALRSPHLQSDNSAGGRGIWHARLCHQGSLLQEDCLSAASQGDAVFLSFPRGRGREVAVIKRRIGLGRAACLLPELCSGKEPVFV